MASTSITAWDEKGKPISTPSATAWDENGKPISGPSPDDPLVTGKMPLPRAPVPDPGAPREPIAPSSFGKWPRSTTTPLQTSGEIAKEFGNQLTTASAALPAFGGIEAASAGKLVPWALKAGRGLVGAAVGAPLGEEAGSRVGGLFGPTGRKVGGFAGALGGGALGGGLAAGIERQPATAAEQLAGKPGRISPLPFGMQRFIPDWMVPKPSAEELAQSQARAQAIPKAPTKGITFTAERPEQTRGFIPRAVESPQSVSTSTGAAEPKLITKETEVPKATKSLIAEPSSKPPDVKVTFQSYDRPKLVAMIKDPATPYATRVKAIGELRRNPGEVPREVSESLSKYMTEPGAGALAWRNLRR